MAYDDLIRVKGALEEIVIDNLPRYIYTKYLKLGQTLYLHFFLSLLVANTDKYQTENSNSRFARWCHLRLQYYFIFIFSTNHYHHISS